MTYLALYRRYRPNNFDNLIGQDHIVKTLKNQIESGRIGHAYLFTGTRGTGKTSAAKIFAKAINCENPVGGSPCGKCPSCLALSSPSNIDVIEIDAASNNGVNEIRDLRDNVGFAPVSCKYKVYIIDEVHMLTGAAFNALLKTLEEPPSHAVFILATTEAHKIPQTILSRCMRFDFRLIPTEKITELISKIYDEQGKEYDKEAITAIARAGEGSIRDALSIADTAISYSTGKLTYDDVMDILGSTNYNVLCDFVSSILDGNAGEVLSITDKLFGIGKSAGVLIKDINLTVRNLFIIKTCDNPNKILELPQDKFSVLNTISEKATKEKLVRIMEIFSETENSLRYTSHPRVVFEQAVIKALSPESDFDIKALLVRIKDLEDKISAGNFTKSNTEINNTKTANENEERENKEQKQKIPVSFVSIDKLKSDLFKNIRSNGNDMMFNVLQDVNIEIKDNEIVFSCLTEGDAKIVGRAENLEIIKEALTDYQFEISVVVGDKLNKQKEMDESAENLKKLFGEDIVIIEE